MNEHKNIRIVAIAALALGIFGLAPAQVPQGVFINVRNTGFAVGVNTEAHELNPCLSPDDKELYYSHYGDFNNELWVATRESLKEPFGNVRRVQDLADGIVIDSGAHDISMCVSYDLRDLYFNSNREGSLDIYRARRAGPGEPFVSLEKLGPKVNTPDIDEGSARISSDGLTLYYTTLLPNPATGGLQADIWIIERESTAVRFGDESGPDPRPLEVNSPIHDDHRPSISSDDLFLFFADWTNTDPRPGGVGSRDIWVTYRSSVDAPFLEPVNLNTLWPGSTVNSQWGEAHATLSAAWPAFGSKFYFLSDRPVTQGGIDIWEATWVPPSPQAAFGVEPESGTAPQDVAVDGSASWAQPGLNIVSYEWDFGDGTQTVQGEQATHTYAEAGLYTVRLTVTDDRDFDIAESGKSGYTTRQIRVSCPPGDTSPWQAADIGQPRFPGSSWKEGDCISLCAGGSLLVGTSDKLHFVWQESSGNFVSTARIEEIDGATSAQVGLMARAGTEPNAVLAAVGIARTALAKNFRFSYRNAAGGSIAMKPGEKADVPSWVKIQRNGDDLIGYSSTDNLTWKELGRLSLTVSPEKLFVGIFALGNEPTNDSSFLALQAGVCPAIGPDCDANGVDDALDISSGTSQDCNGNGIPDSCDIARGVSQDMNSNGIPDECDGGLQRPGDANGDGTLDISDAVATLGFLFLGSPKGLPCGDGSATDLANLTLLDWQPDGAIDISDGIASLSFLFLGGRPHALAPEADSIGCVRIVGCPEKCQ